MADKKDKKDKKKKVVKQKQKQKQTQKQTVNIHLGAKTVRRSAPKASAQKQMMPSFIPIPSQAPTIIYADRAPVATPAPAQIATPTPQVYTLADVPGDLFNLQMGDSVSQYKEPVKPKFSEKKPISRVGLKPVQTEMQGEMMFTKPKGFYEEPREMVFSKPKAFPEVIKPKPVPEPSSASSVVSSQPKSRASYQPTVMPDITPGQFETPVPEELAQEMQPSKSRGGRPAGSGDTEKQRLVNWYVNVAKLGSEKTAKKMSKEELVKRERKYKEDMAKTLMARYANTQPEESSSEI